MTETTLRLHTYHAPNDDHNQRDPETIARENAGAVKGEKSRWIDPAGDHAVLGPGLSLRDAYGAVFGQAIDDYNAHQKRADRKMTVDSYLESVEKSRRGRPVKAIKRANERAIAQGREEDVRKEGGQRTHHEVVISLGNVKPLRGDDGKVVIDPKTGLRVRPNYVPSDVMQAVFRDYIAGFQARNPNLYLFRADFHADEWYRVQTGGIVKPGLPGQWLQGEAHGHLCMIAFADGYQRGPKRQTSITKALAAMGYVDRQGQDGRTVTAWEQWQEAERDELKEIARNYGYEIVPADDSREALAADEYAELADLRESVQDERAKLAEVEARTDDLETREYMVSQREKELDAREQRIADREQEQDERRERLAKAAAELTAKMQEAHDLDERLPKLRRQVKAEQEKADTAHEEAAKALTDAIEWGDHVQALAAQKAALEAQIKALQGEESKVYQDARKRGYEAGFNAGAKEGEKSALGQLNAMMRKDDAEQLTEEQRKANAERDGVGRA